MATFQLRPMSFGEILDGSFTMYRRIFGTLVAIAIVCQGVPNLLGIYVEATGGIEVNLALWVVVLILGAIAALFTFGASLWAISEAYLGRTPSFGGAIRYALGRAWRLFIAGIAAYMLIILPVVGVGVGSALLIALAPLAGTVVMGLGLLVAGVFSLIIACGLSVVPQAAVLEELRAATDSIGRSWGLTKGFKWRAFGLFLISFLILGIPTAALSVVAAIIDPEAFMAGQPPLVTTVIGQVLGLVLYPILNCVFTLFYYDLRVRKEGFDLEHLSRQLGLEPRPVEA